MSPRPLTDTLARTWPGPGRLTDARVPGLALRVTPAGARAWTFEYRTGYGRGAPKRRITLGRVPPMRVADARALALRFRAQLAMGTDPRPVTQTVRDLLAADVARLPNRANRAAFTTHLAPLHALPLAAVTFPRLQRFLDASTAPSLSTSAVKLLAAAWRYAHQHHHAPPWPGDGLRYPTARPRQRHLTDAELARLGAACRVHARRAWTPAFLFALLTGWRVGEVAALAVADVDRAEQVATLRHDKAGRAGTNVRVIGADALALITRTSGPAFAHADGRPLGPQQAAWSAIRRTAQLEDVHAHDLRHTFATAALSLGVPMDHIAALIGHTRTGMTARYAHATTPVLRPLADQIAAHLLCRLA